MDENGWFHIPVPAPTVCIPYKAEKILGSFQMHKEQKFKRYIPVESTYFPNAFFVILYTSLTSLIYCRCKSTIANCTIRIHHTHRNGNYYVFNQILTIQKKILKIAVSKVYILSYTNSSVPKPMINFI
jgi:hypothetical protein